MNHPLQIAINIAFLLAPEGNEAAIELSNRLNSAQSSGIHLNTTDCLPHISLVMGVAKTKDLDLINKKIKEISAPYLPLKLKVTGLKCGAHTTSINLERSPEVSSLQKDLLSALSPLLSYDPSPEMFYGEPGSFDLAWVGNFISNSTGEKFNPHITSGPGSEGAAYTGPTSFTVSQIAICHLGAYCTCKKVLAR